MEEKKKYRILVLEDEVVKKEFNCDGFLLAAFDGEKDVEGIKCHCQADLCACDIRAIEVAALLKAEGSPTHAAHELLLEMEPKTETLKRLFRRKKKEVEI